MGTEGEFEIVPDAADPGPERFLADIVLDTGDEPVADSLEPPPGACAAERARAVESATRHLARVRRRAERGAAAPPGWGAHGLFEARYCAIDLETTGMGAGGSDEILEVGAVQLVAGELGREFASLVQPLRPISPAAHAVHGIAPAQVADAPRVGAVLPYLQEMARDCVLVFHNAPFDLGFLQRALAEAGREPFESPVVDTLVVARTLLGGRCGLGTLGARLGLAAPHLHRALADARLTALVLVDLLRALETAGGRHLGEIPGICPRPPRERARRGPRPDLLAERFEAAAERREPVRVAYRVGNGAAPVELCLLPLRVHGATVLAREQDGGTEVVLALERVESLWSAP